MSRTVRRRRRFTGREKEKLMLDVGSLYCEQAYGVSDIVRELKLSRSTVIRLLNEAIKRGYVIERKPIFRPPQNAALETKLRRALDLKDAIVVPTPAKTDILRSQLGSAAAAYVDDLFQREPDREFTVGLTGGITLANAVERLTEAERHVEVYPLHCLELASEPDYAGAGILIGELAKKLKARRFYGTQRVGNHQTAKQWQEELHRLVKLNAFLEVTHAWEKLDIALMSVAPPSVGSLTVRTLGPIGWGLPKMQERGVAAILNLALLAQDGSNVEDFFLSIPPATLRRLAEDPKRHIILVSGGKSYKDEADKLEAIRTVLNAHLANVVITDDLIAERLLGAEDLKPS